VSKASQVRRGAMLRRVPLLVAACSVAVGCLGSAEPERDVRRERAATRQASSLSGMRQQLLAGAVSILSELDRYDPARAAEQVFDRLNQWSHAAATEIVAGAAPDPLLGTLPDEARAAGRGILERPLFDATGDILAIRDRCWLAAIARSVSSDVVDDLTLAERLFAWTVRSLAPASDPPMVPTEAVPGTRWFLPGEILLAGRGSGPQRAWIFIELLRQAGLDAVMLATPGPSGTPPRPWLPAVLIDGEAYLFEPTYGMPVPGPDGTRVATLRQAAADPAILEALSVPGRPYPVTADDLGEVAVLVVADPWSLAARMQRLDEPLAADHGIRAGVRAGEEAARAEASLAGPAGGVQVSQRGLWAFPWETVARRSLAAGPLQDEIGPLDVPVPDPRRERAGEMFRPLFAGRVREFRGDLDGPGGAKEAYLAARVSRRAINAAVANLPEPQATAITGRLNRMKEDATYWLGLVMLAEGQDEAAEDYLGRMILENMPDSRWADAARINLASALVRLGRPEEAAALLREDRSPQRFGSRLRADRIEARGKPPLAPPRDAAPAAENAVPVAPRDEAG
jgi:hypothetical protein